MTNEPAPDRPKRNAPVVPVPTPTALQPAPTTRPAPPAPGAPDSEWQVCEADLPAVMDALTPLCKQLKLRDRSSRDQVHWHLELLHLELWIDVTAVADGERTLVGVQIRPVRGTFVRPPDTFLRDYLALMAALFVVLSLKSGEPGSIALALSILNLPLLVIALAGGGPWRRHFRAQETWASEWRREFWAALHGRVGPRALYR
ncbi:hypothetical protein OV203_22555 [Nannocystis sp. ILAH1]|uniref:hypothetical protein n=1 Tax=unclassified Nannocystis TaxID=2627009 RepID=UPI00226EDC9D|nr:MULTISPECIES: hypothetical protein [unclassified Nannocystis]MCY0989938.1 hypothetical protein [Nannocystis sp. ILAH1]MCY1071025.1 hypothetical protein [Nannocystis sp. RBIL2]